MDSFELKWVNSDFVSYGVNSLRLGYIHIWTELNYNQIIKQVFKKIVLYTIFIIQLIN